VIEEREQLGEKISKLEMFLTSAAREQVPGGEIKRLAKQCAAMKVYLDILVERIDAFPS
jgi:hypothetical protein